MTIEETIASKGLPKASYKIKHLSRNYRLMNSLDLNDILYFFMEKGKMKLSLKDFVAGFQNKELVITVLAQCVSSKHLSLTVDLPKEWTGGFILNPSENADEQEINDFIKHFSYHVDADKIKLSI